jgi:hypothetical protein
MTFSIRPWTSLAFADFSQIAIQNGFVLGHTQSAVYYHHSTPPHCAASTVSLSSTGTETQHGYDAKYHSKADEG